MDHWREFESEDKMGVSILAARNLRVQYNTQCRIHSKIGRWGRVKDHDPQTKNQSMI